MNKYIYIYPSIYLPIYLSIYLSIYSHLKKTWNSLLYHGKILLFPEHLWLFWPAKCCLATRPEHQPPRGIRHVSDDQLEISRTEDLGEHRLAYWDVVERI